MNFSKEIMKVANSLKVASDFDYMSLDDFNGKKASLVIISKESFNSEDFTYSEITKMMDDLNFRHRVTKHKIKNILDFYKIKYKEELELKVFHIEKNVLVMQQILALDYSDCTNAEEANEKIKKMS